MPAILRPFLQPKVSFVGFLVIQHIGKILKMAKKQLQRFNSGDWVKLIFTEQTGTVVKVIDAEMVQVKLADGDTIPVFTEHLELLEKTPNAQKPTPKPNNPQITAELLKKQKEEAAQKLLQMGLRNAEDTAPDRGLYLALQPFYQPDGIFDYFLVHLVNDTPRAAYFSYQTYLNDNTIFSLTKTLPPRDTLILNDIKHDWLREDYIDLCINGKLLLHKEEESNKNAPKLPDFDKTFTPKIRLLFKNTLKPVALLQNAQAHLYPILPPNSAIATTQVKPPPALPPIDPAEVKINMLTTKEEPKEIIPLSQKPILLNAGEREIDLHIEKIKPDYKLLHKGEILSLQLQTFERNLQEAIKLQERRMVVVHGKGSGKLRTEIMNILREYPYIQDITSDDFHHKYEYGATTITFAYY